MKVNISKRVKLDKGWRFCEVTKNARRVVIDGQEVDLAGRYYIDFLQDGKRVRLAAGATAAEAVAKAEQQEKLLAIQEAADEAGIELSAIKAAVTAKTTGHLLVTAVEDYLVETKDQKKPKTYAAYRGSLKYFLDSCSSKTMLEEITRDDMLKYKTYLKREGQTDRSIRNKFENAMTFFKWCDKKYKINVKPELMKNDWPQYVEEEVEIYTEEQLDAFFEHCTKMEHLWFTFFLETGMREQEVMHADWSWVDFERNVITVRENKKFGWQPKKNKGRQIAVPSSLIASLKEWKTKRDPACGLIFPTTGCRPKLNFLDDCKDIAERAKLNPADFWLHKFRATRITNWLRGVPEQGIPGLDLVTVQKLAGHADLESTARYLAALQIDKSQVHIEKLHAARNGGK